MNIFYLPPIFKAMVSIYLQSFLIFHMLIAQVSSSCVLDLLYTTKSTDDSGKQTPVPYCEYAGVRHDMNTKWDELYPDCLNCTCASFGLECCGYGISAGIEEPPENCVYATGTCEPRLVSANDSSKPCEGEDNRVTSTRRRVRVKLFSLRRKNATVN